MIFEIQTASYNILFTRAMKDIKIHDFSNEKLSQVIGTKLHA